MRKPICILAAVLLLVSLSCQFLFPKSTPQPQPTPQVATVPPALPEPRVPEPTSTQPPPPTTPPSTSTPPPTPTTVVVLEDFTLAFWDARVSYDPAVWELSGEGYSATLTHRQYATCNIREQGPTEPPQADRDVTLGAVAYKVAEFEAQGNIVDWYMAVRGPQGPFADGIPTLLLTSSPDQLEQCRSSAEEVFATMR